MIIEITEDKIQTLSENIEKGLRYLGKAMQCVDELEQQGSMGERHSGNYRYPMGMRDEMDAPNYGERYMGERRGRDSMGRYTRY